MYWQEMKLLWPTFVAYWAFLFAVSSVGWFVFTKSYPQLSFKWAPPFALATAMIFTMVGNTYLSYKQNTSLEQFRQANSPQKTDKQNVDPALQLKADFLKEFEQLMQNPTTISSESKKNLFSKYAKLFPKAEDKKVYEKNILTIYDCQRYFWEDSLTSFKAKKEIKSDSYQECEKAPGTFFNRDKLMTEETVKANTEALQSMAEHKRLPAADGKTAEVNEKVLREAIDRQITQIEATKQIFE